MLLRTLYLGTNPTQYKAKYPLLHVPIIEIVPRSYEDFSIKNALEDFEKYTHIILTSQHAVHILFKHLDALKKNKEHYVQKIWICVGTTTGKTLQARAEITPIIAHEFTQEGIIDCLTRMDIETGYFFIPRSSRARLSLDHFLRRKAVRYQTCDLYDIEYKKPLVDIDFNHVAEIVFTSPSTVDAFLSLYQEIPPHTRVVSIGPITEAYLKSREILLQGDGSP